MGYTLYQIVRSIYNDNNVLLTVIQYYKLEPPSVDTVLLTSLIEII